MAWVNPASAGIVADASAPGRQQPHIVSSANGTPQVNIQSPSAGGVSNNLYSQFDVDKRGVILNNSHQNTPTHIAGMVAANPNLARGEATVILNQVNSRNLSQLNGYIEVAGQKAQIVIANPAGISCDGCGFINANRATLTTGTPQLHRGTLTGYRVNGGNITITGQGLDSREQDYTHIIARSVQVNAEVRAKSLSITTGRNQVDTVHQTITALADEGSEKPVMALDVSALGGMYAGKIRLMGTETGVGVHNAGDIGATAGNVVLTADGRIENSGKISSTGDTELASQRDIQNRGRIYSQQRLTLDSHGTMSNQGSLVSGRTLSANAETFSAAAGSVLAAGVDRQGKLTQSGDILLTTRGQLSAHGKNLASRHIQAKGQGIDFSASQTAAQSISLDAQRGALSTRHAILDAAQTLSAHTSSHFNNEGGALSAKTLQISAREVNNRMGILTQLGTDDFELSPVGTLDNQGGHIRSNGQGLRVNTASLDNRSGEITHAGTGELRLSALQTIENEGGVIQSAGHITTHTTALNNTHGQLIASRALQLTATALNNQDGLTSSGEESVLQLADSLNNRQGRVISTGDLHLTTTELDNRQGVLATRQSLKLQTSSLDNQAGAIKAGKNAQLAITQQLDNRQRGIIGATGDLTLQADRILNQQGKLITNGHGRLTATDIDNRHGQIAGGSSLRLHTLRLNNSDDGQIQSGGDMALHASYLLNRETVDNGGISSKGLLVLETPLLDNHRGLLLAGKSLTLLNTLLDNPQGQIVSQGPLTLSTLGDLNNRQGVIQGDDITLNTRGAAFNNQGGTLYSLSALAVNSGELNNQAGTLGATGDAVLTAATIDNRHGGRIVSTQSVHMRAQTLQNQQGQVQSVGDLGLALTAALNNQQGLLRSGATATIQAPQIDNGQTRDSQQGIEGQNVTLTGDMLNNQAGRLLTNNDLSLTVTRAINNIHGLLSAGDTLQARGNALQVINTAGTLSAGSQLTLAAQNLTGDGALLSTGSMEILSRQAFNNRGSLIANRDLRLQVNDNVSNRGRILAGDTLALHGNNLINLPGGEINAGADRLTLTGTLSNTGLIDGGLAWLDAHTLNNTGTGRIYGDRIGIDVETLNNRAVAGSAPVIAGRQQVNIGVQTLNNHEHALIYSDGTLVLGGHLTDNGAVSGQAATVNNISATLESAGDMVLNAVRLNNINNHFSTTLATVSAVDKLRYQWEGTIYDTQDYAISLSKSETWIICIQGVICNDTSRGDSFNEYRYLETTQETQVTESDPAKVLAAGQLTLNGQTVYNENSEIVAGKTLLINASQVENRQAEGPRIITDEGTLRHYYRVHHKGYDSPGIDTSPYTPPATIQTILLNPGRIVDKGHFDGSHAVIKAQGARTTARGSESTGSLNTEVSLNDKHPTSPPPGAQFDVTPESGDVNTVIRTVIPDTRLPDNSLFNVTSQSNSHYLIETDPRFTNKRQWLASDYMQTQLGIDQAMKRLGDGYYEQRLVREQIIAISGRRYLEGFSDDEAQYKALMDSGVAFAQRYHLRPGVALSAGQMAILTEPLVWLIETTVTLPDGSQQTVLVPQVYAPVHAGALNASGALISGDHMVMTLRGDLVNQGVIGSGHVTAITADTILNQAGHIQGADVTLNARNDISGIGGLLQGLDSLVASAGRDIRLTSTTRHAERQNGASRFQRTTLDNLAQVAVINDNATLVLHAGRDTDLTATQLINAGHASQSVIAAGRDININSITTASQDDVAWNADNTLHQALQTEVGTTLAGQGNAAIAAGHNLNIRAARIHAGDTLRLSAAQDITLLSGEQHSELDERHKTTGNSGMLSKTTATTRDTRDRRTAQGSQLSGSTLQIQAGHDLTVKGSQVIADNDLSARAGKNITVTTADEVQQETHLREEKKSGLMGSGGIGFTIGTQSLKQSTDSHSQLHKGSTLGSTGGDVTLSAGENLTLHGSDVIAKKDINLTGQSVTVSAAENTHTELSKTEQKQSGLTLALSGTVGSALNTAVQTANQAKETDDSRIKALQSIKAGLSAVQAAAGARLADASQGDSGASIGINLSFGSSAAKSETETRQTTAQGSGVSAGNNLSVSATGKAPDSGNIAVTGSALQAGGDIALDARHDITLLSAQNTQTVDGKNSSQGSSVGVGITFGSNGVGFNVNAGASKGKGFEKGNSRYATDTTVSAGNTLTLNSGNDTTLKGAQVQGENVVANVGNNLTLRSEQAVDSYEAKQSSFSAGGSIGFGNGSLGIAASRDKMHSDYASVENQSGIFAGTGGFDIRVGNHTQLDGAAIASAAGQENNRLDSGTLGFADIDNRAEFRAQHQGFGLSSGGSIGGQFAGNMANSLLAGANQNERARGTTQSAIADGAIVVRDRANQQQDVAGLARDTERAHQPLTPIFDKEKAQRRLQQARLIGEIGNQVADIARTEGEIAGEKARRDPTALNQARTALEASGKPFTEKDVAQWAYNTGMRDSGFGTGGQYQQAIQAATAAVQGLAGDNLQAALAGGAAPYIAEMVKAMTTDPLSGEVNKAANVAAHAVVNAALAAAQGNNALAGAAGAATGEIVGMLATEIYQKPVAELSESEKQTVSTLATVAAGLAGGLVGDSGASALAGAQSGKTTTENNALSLPSGLMDYGQASSSLGQFMAQNGASAAEIAQAQSELARGLGTGAPQPATELVKKWALMMSTAATMGTGAAVGAGAAATGGAIGGAANISTQLTMNGDKPFSYTDALIAIGAGALTQGKGPVLTGGISVGGAYVGSTLKGEDPTNAMIGAGIGSAVGSVAGKVVTEQLKPVVSNGVAETIGNIGGSLSSEIVGGKVQNKLNESGDEK
ncbi:hemagglutinin repeat-containing protein [Edwardsiella ictaluri]|nr:hemagglutinin repeat-containing protein [Edwardsiella ictaluri]BEI10597.1 hemagglutinin repeat-containing protein [Edwardsiella ictaluri]BEI14074.1 hemagglutinin repeat-containing protein [Edwardsiella ictaluri]BEI17547.1 hemagglutinin repeat-containing protein [Edwardsiella ictaluri]